MAVHHQMSLYLFHLNVHTVWYSSIYKHVIYPQYNPFCYVPCRVQSLEVALQEKNTALKEHQSKFDKLKEDFKYNLRLLGERDAELARYDALFAGTLWGLFFVVEMMSSCGKFVVKQNASLNLSSWLCRLQKANPVSLRIQRFHHGPSWC